MDVSAQVTQQWLKRHEGGGSDIPTKMDIDSLGNIYVTGSGGPLGNTNIITVKYTSTGQMVWNKVWNGPGDSNDGANYITIKKDAIYITGFTEYTPLVQSNRKKDFATLKYDLNGNLLWVAYYNFSTFANWEDIAYAIDVDQQSNVYVTGSSKSAMYQEGYRDIATIKYNANGNEQWVVRYNAPGAGGAEGTNDDIPVALRVDGAGNVYVTGRSVGDGSGWDYVTLKYNTAGTNLWTKRYSMPGNAADVPYAMKLDALNNVYVTGASSAYGVDPNLWYDFATVKYNTNGDSIWVRRFNSGSSSIPWDEATDLAVDDTGNVYVTGFVPSGTTSGDDICTIKYNAAGDFIWQSRWDSPYGFTDRASRLKLDKTGNIYITGFSKRDGSTAGNDFITLKLNNSGLLQWAERYNGTNSTIDNAYDLVLDNSNGVYVTGQSYGTSDDYVTIKYQQPNTCGNFSVRVSANDDTTFCKGDSVTLSATSTKAGTTFQWKQNGSDILGATASAYTAKNAGTYTVIASTEQCGSTTSNAVTVAVNALPKASISPSGTVGMCEGSTMTLTANTGANLTYQWKGNNVNIAGATGAVYNASSAGRYKVVVTNMRTGCSKTSAVTTINITCRTTNEAQTVLSGNLLVYPNPSSREFTLQLLTPGAYDIVIYDVPGRKITELHRITSGQRFGGNLKTGVYFAQVKKGNQIIKTVKLVKE